MIKQHIKEFSENLETILKGHQAAVKASHQDERCCWGYSCSCDACCNAFCCICCSVVLVFLFSILAIVAILAWYSNIPKPTKYLKSDDDIQHAGPHAALVFLALGSFVCTICVKCCGRRNAGHAVEVLEDLPRT